MDPRSEFLKLVFSACEFVASNSYVCSDECVYQRFLEAELNARFRKHYAHLAPTVQSEVYFVPEFTTSTGVPVRGTSLRADLVVFGGGSVPDAVIEIKATSRVSSHMCYQTHKYGHMFARDRPPPILILANFLQPDNETLFSGPLTPSLVVPGCSPESSTTEHEDAPAPKRKRAAAAATPPHPSAPDFFHTHVAPLATGHEDQLELREIALRTPVNMSCSSGPALFFLVGTPGDERCLSVSWSRFARANQMSLIPFP